MPLEITARAAKRARIISNARPRFILRTQYNQKNKNRMIYEYRSQGLLELPPWSLTLKHYYWFIRVEGRNKSQRVKYYRLIKKEKLRLAIDGVHQEDIRLLCRYLASYSKSSEMRLAMRFAFVEKQMCFEF